MLQAKRNIQTYVGLGKIAVQRSRTYGANQNVFSRKTAKPVVARYGYPNVLPHYLWATDKDFQVELRSITSVHALLITKFPGVGVQGFALRARGLGRRDGLFVVVETSKNKHVYVV